MINLSNKRYNEATMILTIKTTLLRGAYAFDKWEAIFEVNANSSLEDVHLLLQSTLSFDNDHLYDFYVARTATSRDRRSFDDENGGIYDRTISSVFPLPEKKNLYYLFDYGDHWLFKIARSRNAVVKPTPTVKYPRLLRESGTRPQQYPSVDDDEV